MLPCSPQVLQHAWTYKPLVQDVLGMSLNRVTVEAEPSPGQQLMQPNASSKQTFEAGLVLVAGSCSPLGSCLGDFLNPAELFLQSQGSIGRSESNLDSVRL